MQDCEVVIREFFAFYLHIRFVPRPRNNDGVARGRDGKGATDGRFAVEDDLNGRAFRHPAFYFLCNGQFLFKTRVIVCDDQMICVFGGAGNMDGYFRNPLALEHMDYDLIVVDQLDCTITLFTLTDYGRLVFGAMDQFDNGEYAKSGKTWREVMKYNGNYDLAYIGLGRAYLRQKEYDKAMDYFELKYDADNYSKAYKKHRKEFVEDHIVLIVIVILALFLIPLGIGRVKFIKYQIQISDAFKYNN